MKEEQVGGEEELLKKKKKNGGGGIQKKIWLPAFWKKDQSTTKYYEECFLILQCEAFCKTIQSSAGIFYLKLIWNQEEKQGRWQTLTSIITKEEFNGRVSHVIGQLQFPSRPRFWRQFRQLNA